MRGRIDHSAGLLRQRIDHHMHRAGVLIRSPVALPIAFGCGVLAERLRVPGIKHVFGLVAGQMKTLQLASSLLGFPVR